MKYIAIIAAEDKEIEALCEIMSDVSIEKIFNLDVYKGKIKGKNCLVVKSGVGKVNAGRTAQVIIDKFDVEYVINTGSAGATSDSLKVGDIVIGTSLIQHDFDVTAFGREKGVIPEVGKFFQSDLSLVQRFEKVATSLGITCKKGCIASGDKFIGNTDEKIEIADNFEALCTEMEGAAVAQVCVLCNVPFIVARSISDNLIGDAKVDFEEYLTIASKMCAAIVYNVVCSTL